MIDEERPGEGTGDELRWPERWSTSKDAPPLGRAFVDTIERPGFVPTVRHAAPVTPMTRRFGATMAVAVLLGSVVIWRLTPTAHVDDIPALLPADEPTAVSSVAPEPAPPTVAEAEALHAAHLAEAAALRGDAVPAAGATAGAAAPDDDPMRLPEWIERAREAAEDGRATAPTSEPATRIATGTVRISSTPWAELEVDGVPRGDSPRTLTLPAGTHRVRLTRADLAIDRSWTFEVREGETTRLYYDVRPPEGPAAPPAPAAPAPPETADGGRYDGARACAIAGDHRCVVRELRGHCIAAREYELLIASMRILGGHERELENAMRTYLTRYPSGRQAAQYRQYLVAHSGD